MKRLKIIQKIETVIKITECVEEEISKIGYRRIFLVSDYKTKKFINENIFNGKLFIKSQKEKKTVDRCFEFFYKHRIDRNSLVVCVGGGSISDICGFACSVWMRGIDYIVVPTTLLSQIDAGIGGKTAIDYKGIKNIIGMFYFPVAVIINPRYTLFQDKYSYLSALGEIFKYTLIMDLDRSKELEKIVDGVVKRDYASVKRCVEICLDYKTEVVRKDPFDTKGIRRRLNFGHTPGHAIESVYKIPHGYAVFLGCIYELILSLMLKKVGKCVLERYLIFADKFYPKVRLKEDDFERIYRAMLYDKKNFAQEPLFLVLIENGMIDFISGIDKKILKDVWRRLCQKRFL